MALACDIKTILDKVCSIESGIGDQATLQELCDKIEILEEKLCGPCIIDLAEEATDPNLLTVMGDVALDAGQEIELLDDAGAVIGTAEVVSTTYDAASDTTAVVTTNVQLPRPATVAQVKSVKKVFVAQTKAARVSNTGGSSKTPTETKTRG